MKVWVLGAGGLVGSFLVKELESRGIAVVGTTHKECDVTDEASLQRKFSEILPTHLVNCAAMTRVDDAEVDESGAMLLNAKAPELMAKLSAREGARFVHISTDYVFGKGGHDTPYKEEDPVFPVNVYGRSKLEGEKLVLQAMPSACIVRTSWVVAPKRPNFLTTFLRKLQEEKRVKVVSDQVGKLTYCHDLVCALIELLGEEGIVHFSNEGVASRYEMAELLKQLLLQRGEKIACTELVPVPSSTFPARAKRPSYSALDTGRYQELTGKHPRPLLEVMKEFLDETL